jgi:prepilin-type processing-associated H-X9-DG protein
MVEVDLSNAVWRKSRHSASNGCVEIAFVDGHVAVRDSKDRQGPVLVFTPIEWDAFVAGVRDGELAGP